MPATPRPNTDYERWMRDSNPAHTLAAEPDYGQVQKATEMDSALEYQYVVNLSLSSSIFQHT